MFSIIRALSAMPVAAIFILSFDSAHAQSATGTARNVPTTAPSIKRVVTSVANGREAAPGVARKLPFEPVVIYYKVPVKASNRAASDSVAAAPRVPTTSAPKTLAAAKKTDVPRVARSSTPVARSNGITGLEPVMIYYRGFAPMSDGGVSGLRSDKRMSAGGASMTNKPAASAAFSAGPTENKPLLPLPPASKVIPGPNHIGGPQALIVRSLPTKPPAAPPKDQDLFPSVVPGTISDPMMTLTPRPLPNTPASPETEEFAANVVTTVETAESASPPTSETAGSVSGDADKSSTNLVPADLGVVEMNNRAVSLTLEAQYEDAQALLEQAIKAEPNVAKFHRNLSVVFERMKKFDQAVASARNAEKLAPSDPEVLEQLCLLELATRNAPTAVTCYERLSSIHPLDTALQSYYGMALFRSGKDGESIAVLEKAAASTPAVAEALNALGVVYFTKKRIADAVTAFKSAVEAEPELPALRYNLGVAQFASGNRAAAVSQYNLIKSGDPRLANDLYHMIYSDMVVSVRDMASRKR